MRSSRIGFILIIIGFSLLFFDGCRHLREKIPPEADRGILDLTGWDFKKDGPVNLTGEYEFYWKKHLKPSEFLPAARPQPTGFIRVPGFWNNYAVEGKKLSGEGYATYRLTILLNDQREPLALKLLELATAFSVFINGEKVSTGGVPGKTRETTVPKHCPQIVDFEISSNRMEILFWVSNFHHRRGGAWEVIRLGDEKEIRNIAERKINLDLFLFGSIFIMTLYHIGLFVFRKNDRSPIYFSIFCILIALRLLTTGDRYLIQLFPATAWEPMVKLEYLSFYLAVPAFVFFMRSLFPAVSKQFVRTISLLCLVFSLFVVLTPARIFSHTLYIYEVITLISFIYGLYVIIASLSNRKVEALVFLSGFIVLFLAMINDILHVERIIQTGFFTPYGFFVFILSQAFLITLRFSKALSTVERQRGELKGTLEEYKKEIIDHISTEADLRESEEKYRTVLHSIEEAYYEVDLAGNFTFFNDSLCKILGYSKEELIGMNYRRYLSRETAKKVYQIYNEVYRTGKPVKTFSWQPIRKDGTTGFVESSVLLMLDPEYKRIGFRGVARDITERIKTEEQAKLHQHQLMQADKMVALGTLVSGVAHEINNPNNFIMLNAPLLAEVWENAKPILQEYYEENGDFIIGGMKYSEMCGNMPKLFSGISEGANRIKQIVDDLKNYVRNDNVDLKQPVDINAVLKSAITLIANMIENSTNHFTIDYGYNIPLLDGNFQRLEQVMINVIQNACQALADTQKGIFVATTYDEGKSRIKVRVRDEGMGISSEIVPHITDPFFTTKKDSGGVGLGMSISARIVEEHGGTVNFTSYPGKGTAVEIVLPVNRD